MAAWKIVELEVTPTTANSSTKRRSSPFSSQSRAMESTHTDTPCSLSRASGQAMAALPSVCPFVGTHGSGRSTVGRGRDARLGSRRRCGGFLVPRMFTARRPIWVCTPSRRSLVTAGARPPRLRTARLHTMFSESAGARPVGEMADVGWPALASRAGGCRERPGDPAVVALRRCSTSPSSAT